jgi:imidazolonepropionase
MTTLWRNANIASMAGERGWGWMAPGAVLTHDGRIRWAGPEDAIPADLRPEAEHDLGGALVTPGLIDAHTHLVYAGDRSAEFELRIEGASYEEIARADGGIRSTVAATRAATDDALFHAAARRARTLMAEGVTTLEVKSGYGLAASHESRCLAVARRLARELPIDVRTTSLGAHALPPEFDGRADDYVAEVCAWLPQQHADGLVDAVDAFCDMIGFTPAQVERVFEAARRLGLPVKLHAEQLSHQGGAELAARYGAQSCDHLEHLDAAGIVAMKRAGTVAMLLPAAFYFLRDRTRPPVAALREAGVPIALATDHNPGSSPCLSLLLAMNMGCTLFGLSPEKAWRGVTVNAAKALGLRDRGFLAQGARADFAVWDAEHPRELVYRFGDRPHCRRVFAGADAPP